MKLLKKTAAAALCAALTLTSVPVFAAETTSQTPDVKVQLNGKNVEFTDAAPVIKEGRFVLEGTEKLNEALEQLDV